jgi:hypothetical protein
VGIEAAAPRLTVTGPLVKNKIAFTQSFEYRFLRIPISSLPPLERDMKLEGFNSFSQLDVNLNERQSLTASLALCPQKLNYLGLNTFTPQPSTPDLHQRDYMASIQHRYVTGPDSLLLSQFSYKRFDADVTANSDDPYQLFIETTEGAFSTASVDRLIAPSGKRLISSEHVISSARINLRPVSTSRIAITMDASNRCLSALSEFQTSQSSASTSDLRRNLTFTRMKPPGFLRISGRRCTPQSGSRGALRPRFFDAINECSV